MKYLNTLTGCVEETTNSIVIEQITKRPQIYKPVVGDLEEPGATTQVPKKKPVAARKKAKKEVA